MQFVQRRNEIGPDPHRGGNMHGRRERIVRRLAHVDVIVWMNGLLGAQLAPEQLVGAIGDDLVEVHVGLGAGAGLPHYQGEMIVELAVDHLAGGPDDGAGTTLVDQPELAVGFRRGQLDDAERANDRKRHPVLPDAKILAGTLGLRAPVTVGGHIDRAEAIGLGSRRTGFRRCRGSSHE
jgi:hypothetical protein